MILYSVGILIFPILSITFPLLQGSAPEKDEVRDFNDIAKAITHVRREIVEVAPKAAASAVAQPDGFNALSVEPSEPLLANPLANAAIWQEAVEFDAQYDSGGKANKNVYQQFAFLQLNENAAVCFASDQQGDTSIMSSLISRGLQYLHVYPTLFTQPQAADPAKTL
ncbi:MAG: hypothetical protein Q9218_005614, partial [Villophora microphyllina]